MDDAKRLQEEHSGTIKVRASADDLIAKQALLLWLRSQVEAAKRSRR